MAKHLDRFGRHIGVCHNFIKYLKYDIHIWLQRCRLYDVFLLFTRIFSVQILTSPPADDLCMYGWNKFEKTCFLYRFFYISHFIIKNGKWAMKKKWKCIIFKMDDTEIIKPFHNKLWTKPKLTVVKKLWAMSDRVQVLMSLQRWLSILRSIQPYSRTETNDAWLYYCHVSTSGSLRRGGIWMVCTAKTFNMAWR